MSAGTGIAVFLALCIAIVVGLFALSGHEQSRLDAFRGRCDAQGGLVLKSVTSSGGNWLGCYKGVTELPNEG